MEVIEFGLARSVASEGKLPLMVVIIDRGEEMA